MVDGRCYNCRIEFVVGIKGVAEDMYKVLVEAEKHHQGNKSEIGIKIRNVLALASPDTKTEDKPCCDSPSKDKCEQCQEVGKANPTNQW